MKQYLKPILTFIALWTTSSSVFPFAYDVQSEEGFDNWGNSVNEERFISDFSFDAATNQLTFQDNHSCIKAGESPARQYYVGISYRNAGSGFWTYRNETAWNFGNCEGSSSIINVRDTFKVKEGQGGKVKVNIQKLVNFAFNAGYYQLRLFVCPVYYSKEIDTWDYPYSLSMSQCQFYANYFDFKIPTVRNLSLQVENAKGEKTNVIQWPEVHSVSIKGQAMGETRSFLFVEYQDADASCLAYQELSAGKAKSSVQTLVSKRWENEGREDLAHPRERIIRGKLIVTSSDKFAAPDTIDIESVTISYRYPLINNGKAEYKEPGKDVLIENLPECISAAFTSQSRIDTFRKGSNLYMKMPCDPVEYNLYTPKYSVNFLDMDGSLINTQTVTCGSAAKAPETPSHKGYTFAQWSKSFDKVTRDMDIYAQYTNDAFQADGYSVTLAKHISSDSEFAGNAEKIAIAGKPDTLLFDVYVKHETSVTITLESKFDDGEWKSGSSKTVTASKAKAGVTSSLSIRFPKGNSALIGIRSAEVRFKLETASGDVVYTTPMKFGVFYMVKATSQVEALTLVSQTGEDLSTTELGGESSVTVNVPMQYQDTLFLYDVERRNHCIDVSTTYGTVTQYNKTNIPCYVLSKEECAYAAFQVNIHKYTVTFNLGNKDATIDAKESLLTQDITCEQTPKDPGIPSLEGYVFAGWDNDITNPSFSKAAGGYKLTYTAQWVKEEEAHKVKFIYPGGELISEVWVKDGGNAWPPAMKMYDEDGLLFDGWEGDYYNVTEDRTLTVRYIIPNGVNDILTDTRRHADKFIHEGKVYIRTASGMIFGLNGIRVPDELLER